MEANSAVFLSSQVAFIFRKPLLSPESLYSKLSAEMNGLFGDAPTINPVPFISGDKELLDTPVVQAVSEDGKYQVNIARGRIDFYRHANLAENNFADTKEDFLEKVLNITDLTVSENTIQWMGFVVAYIYTNNDLNARAKKIINPDLMELNKGESNSFFSRNTNRINVGDLSSNNLVAIGSGSASKEKQDLVNGIMINQDFNTRPSENIIDRVFVEKYIKDAESLVKIESVIEIIS